MDAEEGREKKRINFADDPSNRVMVQTDLHLLPLDILLEILSRLPITSLIHFKTTSHAGCNLIADPRLPPMFRNRLSNSDPCLILFNYNYPVSWALQLYFVDREGCGRRVRKINPPQHSKVNKLVGSCNGLLCLALPIIGGSSLSHSLLIYNPFVGDAVRVPIANRFLNQSEVYGFGFHPRTGEFKVVRIVYYRKITMVADPELIVEEANEGFATVNESMVQVFTIGTTEWRKTRGPPPPPQFAVGLRPPEALVEGSLHWIILVGTISSIISFDLADEVFEEIPHPPCQRLVSSGYSLSVLNGCLSAAGLVDTVPFDIWVMKQYHVKESWVKQFSFDPYFGCGWLTNASGLLRSFPKVICALKNGEILLLYNIGSLVSYDPVENRFKNLQIVFGFGFHPRTGEFKVVRIVYYQKILIVEDPALDVEEVDEGFATVDESMVQVFTVGTTDWRDKGATPPQLADVNGPPEALVEGSLHWVTVVGMGGDGPIFGIISFELADEVFEEIPHPPCQQLVSRGYGLSVLNGCLSVAGLVDAVHFDIWVMKKYDVKESWVKQFSFDPCFRCGWLTNVSGTFRRFPKVIFALKNGELLLLYNSSSLVSYDPVENTFENLQISGLSNLFHALPFLPSLFSAQATMNL
ncbi:hypothetical protein SLE2022_321660 [Rubroshorea leprosula]